MGLQFIDPELREGRGEVIAARKGKLPHLITLGDIKGDLHMHTVASDGVNTIEEMAQAAQERGYEYIGITDHSQSLRIASGQSEKALRDQIRSIDTLNERLNDFRILKSAEVDILGDGQLDFPCALLKELDYTICSVHSRFNLSEPKQTARILRAMDNRHFTILGHATGRRLLKRPGYEIDLPRIFQQAQKNGCYFEINSSPERLDLSDVNAKAAKERGIKLAVNTDAHSVNELDLISAGLNQARRAWLESTDVLNTLPLNQLLKLFNR